MAGKFGAICSRATASLFSPRHRRLPLLPSTPTPPRFLPFSRRLHPGTLSTTAMASSNGAAATDAVQEPPQKISKLAPLLKVKKLSDKAVLPSRGSALAAGYDLSRYALCRRPLQLPRSPRGRADLLTVCFFGCGQRGGDGGAGAGEGAGADGPQHRHPGGNLRARG